jgi:putative zinc finger protein
MAECRPYSRWIPLFVSGDLDESRSDRLRAHLAECEDCAVLAARYREDRRELARYARLVRSESDLVAGEDWWNEIRPRVGEIGAPETRVRRIGAARTWSIAAGLLVAAGLGFWIADRSLTPRPVPTDGRPYGERLVPVGGGLDAVSEDVTYPIRNFSQPFVGPGLEPDVDSAPGDGSDPASAAPRPRVRVLVPAPRGQNY